MALEYPRAFAPGVSRVLGGSELVDVDTDEGVSRLVVADRNLLVLHQRPPDIGRVLAEADRLMWLDERGGAPRVVATGRAVEGDEASVSEIPDQAVPLASNSMRFGGEVHVAEAGVLLRRLHEIPVSNCPFDTSTVSLVREVTLAVRADSLPTVNDGPYANRAPQELLGIVEDLLEGSPTVEPVFVHGGVSVERMWFGSGGAPVLTGWSRGGVGDRHLDLALAATSLSRHFGPAVVAAFLDGYGIEHIDLRVLDAHQLLVHLLS